MAAFVNRYGDRVPAIIIWNEPNLALEWGFQPIDPEGYTEWRGLDAAAHVTIDAGTAWYAYDEDLVVLGSGSSSPQRICRELAHCRTFARTCAGDLACCRARM